MVLLLGLCEDTSARMMIKTVKEFFWKECGVEGIVREKCYFFSLTFLQE